MDGLDGNVSPNITPSLGGTTMDLAEALLDGALVLVAAALFAALAVLVVRQLAGSGDDMRDTSRALRRACGMLAIVLVIVFLARGVTELAAPFEDANEHKEHYTSLEAVITHHGAQEGDWSDGEERRFGSLGETGTQDDFVPPHDNSDDL